MYLRTIRSQGREYVQLAHNHRDPKTGKPRAQILYHFGRKDQLDLEALRRLLQSICRFLPPAEAQPLQQQLGLDGAFEYLGSQKLGGSWLLEGLWRRLGLATTVKRLLRQHHYRTPVERSLFAMVANRALAPSSKLALEDWVAHDVWIAQLPQVGVQQLYRAMDFLLEAQEAIQREVYWTVANLLNLEVDVLFLDTTSTYFEIEGEDLDIDESEGLRKWGYSRDGRPHQAQVVIGFAVTRDAIPVRCWVWPGHTVDQNLVAQVKRDLNEWKLGRILTVLDTGFNSETNRRILQGAGDHYIIGEKLRLGQEGVPAQALQRAGKYQVLEDGLQIKEVLVGRGSTAEQRFVVVRNPEEAQRDRHRREEIVARLGEELAELAQLSGKPHTKKACALRAHPALGRYLRQTKRGKLRLDRAKIRAEAQFDGKFLMRTSDSTLSAEDVVRGYKQLWQIERVHRDLKHTVDIRPVYHRLEDRIRAHVLLCWLGLLLIRVAENQSRASWHQIKRTLAGLDVGRHRLPQGEVCQTSPVTPEQKALLGVLQLPEPPRYLRIAPTAA